MFALINDPTIALRIIMPILSVTTGVGMVAAGVSLGVIISKGGLSGFTTTTIVLQAPATIVVNRYIDPTEIPYFYDVIGTMNAFLDNMKKVLNDKFGEKCISIQFQTFSPTPNVTSKSGKQYISSKRQSLQVKLLEDKKDSTFDSNPGSTWKPTTEQSTLEPPITVDTTVYTTPSDSCMDIKLLPTNCPETLIIGCHDKRIINTNCTVRADDVISCVKQILPDQNCTVIDNATIKCKENTTITLECNTNSTSNSSTVLPTNATTRTTTPTTVRTTITDNNSTSQCNTPQNATVQSSIIFSKMLLYFEVKIGETISVEEIVDALKNLKPPIILFTRCLESSSQPSSFNTTLSKVEPPIKVNIDPSVLKNEPGIPTSLQDAVKKAANDAIANSGFLPPTTTTGPATAAPVG